MFRQLSARATTSVVRSTTSGTCRRLSVTTARLAQEKVTEGSEDAEGGESEGRSPRRAAGGRYAAPKVPSLNEWLNGEGAIFKEPGRSRNWLGGDVVCDLLSSTLLSHVTDTQSALPTKQDLPAANAPLRQFSHCSVYAVYE
jgi:hypothetical protein